MNVLEPERTDRHDLSDVLAGLRRAAKQQTIHVGSAAIDLQNLRGNIVLMRPPGFTTSGRVDRKYVEFGGADQSPVHLDRAGIARPCGSARWSATSEALAPTDFGGFRGCGRPVIRNPLARSHGTAQAHCTLVSATPSSDCRLSASSDAIRNECFAAVVNASVKEGVHLCR